MKKISFITIHVGFNFGSVLQTIATYEIFNSITGNVIVVNYIPPRVTFKRYVKVMFSSPLYFLKRIVMFPNYLLNKYIYTKYLVKYVKLSKPCYSEEDVKNEMKYSDFCIVGSDQVWNSSHNEGVDRIYYLPFVEKRKLFSFSSSFGRDELSSTEYDCVKKYLSNFSGISVREDSAKKIVTSMNLDATHLIDPTLLLDKSKWVNYMSKRKIKKPYLLIYLPYNITNKDEIIKSINLICQKKNIIPVSFSWDYMKSEFSLKTLYYCSPGDFLSLMYYADFIITNSFHGTAFAINLNKNFVVYNPSKFSTRISSLLQLTSLNDRLFQDVVDVEILKSKIDYSKINKILEKERLKSDCFIKNNLKCI